MSKNKRNPVARDLKRPEFRQRVTEKQKKWLETRPAICAEYWPFPDEDFVGEEEG